MLYFVDLYGELNKGINELAKAHTGGDVPKLLKLLALQACCPEAAQAIYGQEEGEDQTDPPPVGDHCSL